MSFLNPTRWKSWMVRLGVLILIAVACSVPRSAMAADSAATLEYKVKAGYLFNFAKFIDWPTNAFLAADSPFIIAVLDAGESAPLIEEVLTGKSVNGHPVQIRVVAATSLPTDAHILFVTRAAGQTPEQIRNALGATATLLVGETDEFAERGGAIGFVRAEESIRLTLCLEHAVEIGLKVSARLASVAKLVKSKRKP